MSRLDGHISDFGQKGQERPLTKDEVVASLAEIRENFNNLVKTYELFGGDEEKKNIQTLVLEYETKVNSSLKYLTENEGNVYKVLAKKLRFIFESLK